MDPQANSTSGLGLDKTEVDTSIYDILVNDMPVKDVVKQTEVDWLDIMPSSMDLTGAEIELVNMSNREKRLKNVVDDIKSMYETVFIDCPPSLGLLTLNALVASDSVLIPIQCEYLALEGLAWLLQTIKLVQANLNKNLEIEGVLLTMYDSRLNLSDQVADEIKKFFSDKVYKTIIPRNVRLAEAPSFGKPVSIYDRFSKGSEAYADLAKEFIKRQKEEE
jgi:chromosome partitioning protein